MDRLPSDKILVTGASGFVGGFLLEKLLENNVSRDPITALHYHDLDAQKRARYRERVKWHKVDLTTDELDDVVAEVDIVFHLAGYSTVNALDADCSRMKSVNIAGSARLAKACKLAGVKHFIFISSIAACESGYSSVIDEDSGFPISCYGKTKKLAEDAVMALSGDGFEVTVLRPTALFGEHHLGSVYELVNVIDSGLYVIFGTGSNHTNFYYIRDFIDVLIRVMRNANTYSQIFIAADRSYSLLELVSCIGKELDSERKVWKLPLVIGAVMGTICDYLSSITGKPLPFSKRRFRAMIRNVSYSNIKLTNAIGLAPRYGVLVGVGNSIGWYRGSGLI